MLIKMKQKFKKNGSKIDDWATPDYIFNYVRTEFGDFFDPCPLNADFDGLSIEWNKVNYINPPYSRPLKDLFIKKAYEESKKGKICIMLIPATTETIIFQDTIYPNAEIRLIKGRIKFKGWNTKGVYVENACGQTGSMLCIFGLKPCVKTVQINKTKSN